MISTDDMAFEAANDTRRRFESYAKALGEVHFVVIGSERHEPIEIEKGSIVSAHGKRRIAALFRAYKLGAAIKGIEVVSSQDPFEQGIIAWLIAKRIGAKLHIQIHTDIGSPYFKVGLKNKIRCLLAKFILPRADAIRAVSERVKKAAVHEFGAPLHLISILPIMDMPKEIKSNMNSQTLKEAFPHYDSTVLVISRLEPEKNVALALRAFAIIAKAHPKTGLFILGDGREKSVLSALAVSLGIDAQVRFLGFRHDAEFFLKHANMYLLTSDYEGYGRTLIETAAAGCPIVTTDVGLIGSILTKEEALICPPRNEKCLATHLSLLLENPKLGAHLAAAAQKAALPILHEENRTYLTRYRDDIARAVNNSGAM